MKKGLVFAGGGSKGAYQIGAWKALEELGERFQIATGTSIGSINAGFYVQHDFDAANEMWRGIKAEQIMTNGINMDKSLEALIAQRENLIPFIKTYFNSKGADVTPFHEQLKKYYDPEKFFGSDIDYALITVKYPSFTPVEKRKSDFTDRENVWQWMAASGAAFPVFPVMKIDGEEYVDGGYYDNIPVASAFKLGAEEVTVIDLKTEKNHEGYLHHPRVRYIKPTRDLGAFLNFDRRAVDFSLNLGYFDTMKVYGRYFGHIYTFSFPHERMDALRSFAREFVSLLTLSEAQFDFSKSVRVGRRVNMLPGCTTILAEALSSEHPDETELFFAALEMLLTLMDRDPDRLYNLEDLLYELKLQADGMYPMLEYETETAFSYAKKFVADRAPERSPGLKSLENDRNMLILTALLRTLQRIRP